MYGKNAGAGKGRWDLGIIEVALTLQAGLSPQAGHPSFVHPEITIDRTEVVQLTMTKHT